LLEIGAMKEKDIKKLYFRWLLENEPSDTVVVNEFSSTYWDRRADLLVVNGCIQLVEIKSEYDNLSRLDAQIEYFLNRGHKVTLIISEKHKDKIKNIPSEVGIFWIKEGELILERSPKRRSVETKLLAEYWRLNELRLLFKGVIKGVYKLHLDKLQLLFSSLQQEIADKLTCDLLKARYKKHFEEVRKKGELFIPRVAKRGLEDPRRDYPEFFKEAKKLLLPYGEQMTFSFAS